MSIKGSQSTGNSTVCTRFNSLSWPTTKKIFKLCICGPFYGNPPVTGGFHSQRATNVQSHVKTSPRSNSCFVAPIAIRSVTVGRDTRQVIWYRAVLPISFRELQFQAKQKLNRLHKYGKYCRISSSCNGWNFVEPPNKFMINYPVTLCVNRRQ